jgi:glycosyltransferase involved in cell wall biosynthesis
MKNILFLFGGMHGGIANYVKNIIDTSENLNYFVCSEEFEKEIYKDLFSDIDTIDFPINKGLIHQIANIFKLVKSTSKSSWTINAHALKMGLLASILKIINPKIRFVYTDHGSPYKQKKSILVRTIYFIVEYAITQLADKRVFIRTKEYDEWRRYKSIDPSNLLCIPTEIDLPTLKSKKAITNDILIIMTGKFYHLKNPDLFYEIASQDFDSHQKVKFLWVGEGAEKSPFKAENLEFQSQLSQDKIVQLHQSASILLVTSRIEIVPLMVIEAMKYNTLVISYAYEGVEELIKNGVNGYIFESVAEAKSIIEESIKSPLKSQKIIDNARRYVENERLNTKRFKKRYNELF